MKVVIARVIVDEVAGYQMNSQFDREYYVDVPENTKVYVELRW